MSKMPPVPPDLAAAERRGSGLGLLARPVLGCFRVRGMVCAVTDKRLKVKRIEARLIQMRERAQAA